MSTHVFHISSNSLVEKGLKIIYRLMALELAEYGFDKLTVPTEPVSFEDIGAYREFLINHPTFITVHMAKRPLQMDPAHSVPSGVLVPNPTHFRFSNMGKELKSHFMVAGAPNTGKTIFAEVLKRNIERFAPGAKVYLIDTDDCSPPFYSHATPDELAARVSYIKTMHHVLGESPLVTGLF